MNVVLFGATGMVGQGVLRECLLDPDVRGVLTVGRSVTGRTDPKLREIVHKDLLDLAPIESELSGCDACFFCLGVASAGMTEATYRRVTFDITLAAATTLVRLNPGMTFVYVSGAGADSMRARAHHVGARPWRDRERGAPPAVQGRGRHPPGGHHPAAWHHVEDGPLPRCLHADAAVQCQ